MIADTTFLIDLMRNDPSAVRKAEELESAGTSIAVTAPTIFELYVGVALAVDREAERSKITGILVGLPQLPLDPRAAKEAGGIYGNKLKTRSKMDPPDAMIAGIAQVQKQKVITRTLQDFSNIQGLQIEPY